MAKLSFQLGQEIYHRANPEERRGIITGIIFRPTGATYLVTWDDMEERYHFECELTDTKHFSTSDNT